MTLWEYRADVEEVIDADTIDVRVDFGFYTYKSVRVRLYGVDTHEIYGGTPKDSEEYQRGMEEKRFVESFINDADTITVRTTKDEKDTFGRWLGYVFVDGESLNERLKEEFDGVAHDG